MTAAGDDLLARRRRVIGPSLSLSYRRPLTIVRGRGAYLYDTDGRAYLDLVNNVAHVGHAHPSVVAAAARQQALLETNTRYLHPAILDYAERLTATLPPSLEVAYLVNSGSEANELALRLARAATGRRDVAVLDGAYHGNTTGLADISPYKFDGPGGTGRPEHVHVAPLPDPYRGRHRGSTPETGAAYAADVRATLEAAAADGRPVGALIAESAPGTAGQVIPPPGFLSAAFDAVRAAGGVAIADEIQVGLGRVGRAWWSFQLDGALPDIVTMGKPLGNGHPLGAVVTTRAIADAFANGMEYFNTFGGNPVSASIGLAVLDVIEAESLRDGAAASGDRFLAGLDELARRHPAIGDVRGQGLFIGVVLVRDRETREPATELAAAVVEGALERGILLSTDGPGHDTLKIKPPLVIEPADIDRAVEALDAVLTEIGTGTG
jgi:4-aminobutyrate aminotransferase-like enzyme